MNQQPTLFDLGEGQRRKQDGIALVTFHGSGWLNRARTAAQDIAHTYTRARALALRGFFKAPK